MERFRLASVVCCMLITSLFIDINEGAPAPPSTQNEKSPRNVNLERKEKSQESISSSGSGRELYLVEADKVIMEPSYEPSVNPFLSHLEQGWKLKPLKQPHHHRSKKKAHQSVHSTSYSSSSSSSPNRRETPIEFGISNKELFPANPSRPHFIDSSEDDRDYDDSAFGDDEKNFGDLIKVLFSSDY